ncbi:Alcohol dehydrogenase superfamily [Cinnamomum micranthum f. kanehirae]|uniref:Alcohol dehydrogenase superfamily n=1 Tax=Cinnamomum micranthum f. kanehirae TaxID=337451 RepID=A0A3S3N9Z1_9MAGN|nr:Alcohol dehydrogenase superfamily [Cinnamomum micranthum f. kanehirae]
MKAVVITSPGGQKSSTPAQGGRKPQSQRRRGPDKDRGHSSKPGRYVTEKGIVSAAGGREPVPGPRMRRHRRIGRLERHPMDGYEEKVVVPAGQVLPVPRGISLIEAASFPEIHGGSSGIGTFSIQIAKHQGARVFVTAGSEEKLTFCKELGADVCINYKTEDFVVRVKEETGGKGVDVILDNVGGPYFQRNLNSLNVNGRLFIIGFQGGTITEANLGCMLARCLTVQVSEVEKNVWPAIAAGKVKPVVYKSFPLYEAAEAHRLMESSKHIGKILLIP